MIGLMSSFPPFSEGFPMKVKIPRRAVPLVRLLFPCVLLAGLLFCRTAFAANEGDGVLSHSFVGLIKAGGLIGLVIFLLSLWGGAEAIRLFLTLRREKISPSGLIEEIERVSGAGAFHQIPEICGRHPSFLASVLLGGFRNAAEGWSAAEKGLEESLEAESARLYRKTDFLALVGSIAPMLGLLGTVLGMLSAFGELAVSEGLGRFANLAQGIYLALVTTVDGLVAAIPALALCAFFHHRIAELVSDAAQTAESLTLPLKEYLQARRAAAPKSAEIPRAELPPAPEGRADR